MNPGFLIATVTSVNAVAHELVCRLSYLDIIVFRPRKCRRLEVDIFQSIFVIWLECHWHLIPSVQLVRLGSDNGLVSDRLLKSHPTRPRLIPSRSWHRSVARLFTSVFFLIVIQILWEFHFVLIHIAMILSLRDLHMIRQMCCPGMYTDM